MIDLVYLIETYGLFGLFVNIFLSYSIFPTLTEVPIIISLKFFDSLPVFLVALIAATLGSITNYYIGLFGIRKFFPENRKLKKAEKLFNKYGDLAIIFLTWLPFIGDPIILVAGTLKMKFWKFLLYSTISKIWYLGLLVFFGILLF